MGVFVWSAFCHVNCSSQMGGLHTEFSLLRSLCGQLAVMWTVIHWWFAYTQKSACRGLCVYCLSQMVGLHPEVGVRGLCEVR